MNTINVMDLDTVTGNANGNTLKPDEKTGYLTSIHQFRTTGFTAEKKVKFIEALMENPNLGYAQNKAGICANTYNNHFKLDPVFREDVTFAVKRSEENHRGDFENEMLTRGKKGHFLYMMAWLRRHYPGEYSETKRVEVGIAPDLLSRLDTGLQSKPQVVDAEIVGCPTVCPGCKSPYWDTPKKLFTKEEKGNQLEKKV